MLLSILAAVLLGWAQDKRIPAPDPAAQKDAEAAIRDLFKEDYAKKAPADKATFARKLLKQAAESKDDPVSRFVLLRESRDLALQGSDLTTALDAVALLSKDYAVDASAMRATVIGSAEKAAKTPDELKAITQAWLKAADEAVSSEDFAGAEKAATSAGQVARKAKDVPLVGRCDAKVKEVADLKKKHERVVKARETLAANPEDPAANAAVGHFLLTAKGDVQGALPLLAKGSDAALKSLAEKDRAGATSPAEQAALGDSWWTLGDKESGVGREAVRQRAAHWYGQAVSQLSGLTKAKVERRIAESKNEKIMKGVWLDVTDPALFQTQGKKGEPIKLAGEQGFGLSATMREMPPGARYDGFTVRAAYPPGAKGELRVHFENGKRFVFVNTKTGQFAVLSDMDTGKWDVLHGVPIVEASEYIFTILLGDGEWIVYLNGDEMYRLKTKMTEVTYLGIWAKETTGLFDLIKIRKKD